MKFRKIHLHSVDRCGLNFEIHGTYDERPYSVNMHVECDGREVDTEPLGKGKPYDPFPDNYEIFEELCVDERFIEQSEAGRKVWELLIQVPE